MTRTVNVIVNRRPRPLPPLRASFTPRFIPQYAVLKLVKDGLHWRGSLTARSPQTGETIRVTAVRPNLLCFPAELVEAWHKANEARQGGGPSGRKAGG